MLKYYLSVLLTIGCAYAQRAPNRSMPLLLQGDRIPLNQIQSRGLHAELQSLRTMQVHPKSEEAIVFGAAGEILAVALEQDGHSDDLLYVYYMEKLESSLYLHGRVNEKGRPELRLWSEGESELLFTEEKMELELLPSPSSFRRSQVPRKDKSRTLETQDVIRCIAQSLGLTVDFSSALSFIRSASASAICAVLTGEAKRTWDLWKTAALCLSAVSIGPGTPVAIGFCVSGVAIDVACNLLNGCTAPGTPPPPPEPSGCLSAISPNMSVPGNWASGCLSTQRQGRFARLYTFSLAARSTVTINLRSPQGIDTYLYLSRGTGNTGPVVTYDDDGGGNLQSRITATLDQGSYTIEATTFAAGVSGAFGIDFTAQPVAAPPPPPTANTACTGTITPNSTVSGTWVSSCTSTRRSGAFSKQYTLTLQSQSRLQIDLESPTLDTYLVVSQGASGTGPVVDSDDDGGVGLNSRIVRTFAAGTYTIECTPYNSNAAGNFSLTVRVVN